MNEAKSTQERNLWHFSTPDLDSPQMTIISQMAVLKNLICKIIMKIHLAARLR